MNRSIGSLRLLHNHSEKFFPFAVALLIFICGCSRDEGPPPALTLEQLPAAIERAFARAKPEASEPVKNVLTALGEKDYPKALIALQTVSALPGLNKNQARVVAAGLVTINSTLQEAQSHGDQNAAQTLQTYRATK